MLKLPNISRERVWTKAESCSRIEIPDTFLPNWNTNKLHYTQFKQYLMFRSEEN